jgi:KamA family protein
MFMPNTPTLPQRTTSIRYITDLAKIPQLTDDERRGLEEVVSTYPFRANDYYTQLINWDDPNDPIRQLIIPRPDELSDCGAGNLDACNEASHTVAHGLQHKYPDTAVLLCNEVCGGFCRYCFRKRLFMDGNAEASLDVSPGLRYIAEHPEITNVLLTGGDPLLLGTPRLVSILAALREIPHVRVIRLGSKMLAFNPWRILDDKPLRVALRRYSTPYCRIYLMNHFDHARELTEHAVRAIDEVLRSGVICCNQCPMIRGINDDPQVLSDLFRKLSWIGSPPYYVFQCRPTAGNSSYAVPLVRSFMVFREALRYGSGIARRARFIMSHATGKIEVLAVDDRRIYLRYLRAKDAALRGQFLICKRNDDAYWFDELEPEDGAPAAPAGATDAEMRMTGNAPVASP